ncbi:hypothetical protein [Bradyrhizobium brasilense]|uniref:hypothetical protein n=1 Tax=Bradyrhizobium brasilense TaxID=1419277 RepID=UPI0028778B45|nr:hypothetical protein [Bradyrhizobium brasilense]
MSVTITADIDAEVSRTAGSLGAWPPAVAQTGQLSGGQRRGVAVDRAMVRHPAIFLIHEPLSHLDAKLRVQMRAEIKELQTVRSHTFAYVTHFRTGCR